MAPTYNTTAHGLRWLPGGNLISDIDAGFQALAEDVDTKLLSGGKSIIATQQSPTSTPLAFVSAPTPDRVTSVVVPTDALLEINFSALMRSTAGTPVAALFVGADEILKRSGTGAPIATRAPLDSTNGWEWVCTDQAGLTLVGGVGDASTVSTPMVRGQTLVIDNVTAGTYTIEVKYLVSSTATMDIKERKLRASVVPF